MGFEMSVGRFGVAVSLILSASVAQTSAQTAESVGAAMGGRDLAPQIRNGTRLLWGVGVERDIDRAQTLLRDAATQGSVAAKATLGEALIAGVIRPPNREEGLLLMEQAVASMDAEAMVALGKFFLYGQDLPQDRARAEVLFEKAAATGNAEGIEALGSDLMWSRRDRRRAEDFLARAGEMGRGSAWVTLAEGAMYGYLGQSNRNRFSEFTEKAQAAGAYRIVVLEAERYQWGISVRADGNKALAMLEQAAADGNATALRELVALNRDGNQYNIRKRPERATANLDTYGDLLTPDERAYYSFSIDAAEAKEPRAYAAIAQRYAARDWRMKKELAEDLYAANPNFVVFLLQRDMKTRGPYSSSVNGLATATTIKALFRDCRTLAYTRDCRNDVLSPGVIADLLLQ